jgi:putative RNA 2'-phosphotransferase
MLQQLHLTREQLDEIVATDAKGRYSYDDTGMRIRANQGHSIDGVELNMESPKPPEYLYHGTATRFLESILRDGLKPMNRQWVHISPDFETAVMVGKRHGKPVVLEIRARQFVADGHELFRSANGVWQAKAVHPEYFTVRYLEEN